MPLPEDINSPEKTYRIRVCVLVYDDPIAGFITGSKVHTCDRCEAPIWVDENQVIPDIPDATPVDGDFNICKPCLSALAAADSKPVEYLGPVPEGWTLD